VLEKVTRQEVLAHVQAGLITIPSGNGAPSVSGSTVNAFDARARGATSGPSARGSTRKTRSTSLDVSQFGHQGHSEPNALIHNVDQTLANSHEEEARRKRRRVGAATTGIDRSTESLHMSMRGDLHLDMGMDPSLLEQ
jgi:hypothetical protein